MNKRQRKKSAHICPQCLGYGLWGSYVWRGKQAIHMSYDCPVCKGHGLCSLVAAQRYKRHAKRHPHTVAHA